MTKKFKIRFYVKSKCNGYKSSLTFRADSVLEAAVKCRQSLGDVWQYSGHYIVRPNY